MGEEAVVADADEALGKDVQEEAARKLLEGEREGPGTVSSVVLVAEGDGLVINVQQPRIRDGDAVRVAGQVGEHAIGSIERWLGIDDPLGSACLAKKPLEGS
jgi:hypothetical protein